MGASMMAQAQQLPGAAAAAQPAASAVSEAAFELRPSARLPLSRPKRTGQSLPIFMSAQELRGRPDRDAVAEGDVEFRQGNLLIRADTMSYDMAEDLATARGHVRIERDGDVFTGPELQLRVNQFEGYFLSPTYYFALTQAGGKAQRVDFINDQRVVATGATYSSCPPDGSQDPPWFLSADRVRLNFDENEGVAEGGVLRFFGVPILAAPTLSFPLTDERKSGWLPPNYDFDTRSGVKVSAPYYWNIAPNRDATFTPAVIARRGFGLDSEFRYLEPRYEGALRLHLLPNDRLTRTDRFGLNASHESNPLETTQYGLKLLRVSDDDYWKDFPRSVGSLTPRLLLSDAQLSRSFGEWTTYARVMKWQVLQGSDPVARFETPYERAPQLGLRTLRRIGGGLDLAMEAEVNHFVNPTATLDPSRVTGTRAHTLASLSRAWATPGWTLTPRLSLNAASYDLDQAMTTGPWAGQRRASRVIPTFSIDSQWVLERDAQLFGRGLRQTLEPRLVYSRTPYKDQSGLPMFDSAPKDFNLNTLYSDNVFSGIDRVSDANQVTMGVTTRWLDPENGAEMLHLGLAQRYLLRTQKITAEGTPSTRSLSDVYLDASTSWIPKVVLSSALQYNPEIGRAVSYSNTATYAPAPFKVLSVSYTGARNFSEQVALGWQWPLYGPASTGERGSPLIRSGSRGEGRSCAGTVYGVGRVNYSMRDSRVTDSIVGFEYDAGCWIGRVVAERLSTGLNEATSRVLIQLELVGLSRLGANPLQLLKDNVPGYRLLRDRANPQTLPGPYD
jgi:LPS-assembly protein